MAVNDSSRDIFLKACSLIARDLSLSRFRTTQRNQRLIRTSLDGEFQHTLYFQSSSRNTESTVAIIPHVIVSSSRLKQWQVQKTGNSDSNGVVYSTTLGELSGFGMRQWNVASDIEGVANELVDLIQRNALPVFEVFQQEETALKFLSSNGAKFTEHCDYSIMPLDFLISRGTPEQSTVFFNVYVASRNYRQRIYDLFRELAFMDPIDLSYSEFRHADKIKLAFVCGIKLQ